MLLVLFLVILPACNKIRSVFFDSGEKYVQSFEDFVEGVNEMAPGTDTQPTKQQFPIELEHKGAMVGFRSDVDKFECFNCWDKDKKYVYDKPSVDECDGKACVCLCRDELKFEEKSEDKEAKVGKCDYLCKSLKEDIVEQTQTVNVKRNIGIIWNNGFLFAGLLSTAGGISSRTTMLYVDKSSDTIAVCNEGMFRHNMDSGIGGCMDIKTAKAPMITPEQLEEGGEVVREILLSRAFDGFVDFINGLEEHGVVKETLCHKRYDLIGFPREQYMTFEEIGGKGKLFLRKGQFNKPEDASKTEVESKEVEVLVPYILMSGLSKGQVYDHLPESKDFKKYVIRPGEERGGTPSGYDKAFFRSENQVVFIHNPKNGKWLLTTNYEVGRLADELGPECWR